MQQTEKLDHQRAASSKHSWLGYFSSEVKSQGLSLNRQTSQPQQQRQIYKHPCVHINISTRVSYHFPAFVPPPSSCCSIRLVDAGERRQGGARRAGLRTAGSTVAMLRQPVTRCKHTMEKEKRDFGTWEWLCSVERWAGIRDGAQPLSFVSSRWHVALQLLDAAECCMQTPAALCSLPSPPGLITSQTSITEPGFMVSSGGNRTFMKLNCLTEYLGS